MYVLGQVSGQRFGFILAFLALSKKSRNFPKNLGTFQNLGKYCVFFVFSCLFCLKLGQWLAIWLHLGFFGSFQKISELSKKSRNFPKSRKVLRFLCFFLPFLSQVRLVVSDLASSWLFWLFPKNLGTFQKSRNFPKSRKVLSFSLVFLAFSVLSQVSGQRFGFILVLFWLFLKNLGTFQNSWNFPKNLGTFQNLGKYCVFFAFSCLFCLRLGYLLAIWLFLVFFGSFEKVLKIARSQFIFFAKRIDQYSLAASCIIVWRLNSGLPR